MGGQLPAGVQIPFVPHRGSDLRNFCRQSFYRHFRCVAEQRFGLQPTLEQPEAYRIWQYDYNGGARRFLLRVLAKAILADIADRAIVLDTVAESNGGNDDAFNPKVR